MAETEQPYRKAYVLNRLPQQYDANAREQIEANFDRIYKLIRGINDNGELPEGAESDVLVFRDGRWAVLEFDATVQRVIGNATGEPAWEQVDLAAGVSGRLPYANMQQLAASRLLGRGSAGGTGNPEPIDLGAGLTMTNTTLSASAGGGWIPLVDGSEPPNFITLGNGVLALVAGP